MQNKTATDVLVEAISTAAQNAVQNAKFDVSSYGVVTNKNDNTYTIAAFGGEYTVTTNRDYEVGQKLVVTAMQKNFRNIVLSEGNHSLEIITIRTLSDNVDNVTSDVNKLSTNLDNLVTKTENNQQSSYDQAMGKVQTHYGHGVPTESNYPASNWTNDWTKRRHKNDIYYDIDTGKCYRYVESSNSTFEWTEVVDSTVVNAIASAALAQTTADSKCKLFYDTPTVPYNVGDLWAQGPTGELFKCITAKTVTGRYSYSDWEKATKYTDDTTAETAISQIEELAQTEKSHYDELKDSVGQGNTNYGNLGRRVTKNENNIKTLSTTVSGITPDAFLEALGLKINSLGELCYVTSE